MIVIYSSNHEAAPLLDDPLEEHNVARRVRPVYKKIRKVRGKTGWILRRYGHFLGAPKGDQIGLGHHALQIGAYVYEMTREKGLVGQRLAGDQIWMSTVGEMMIGYTDMSDEDIQLEALKAQAHSRSRNGGKYHIKHNNCQHFIVELQRRITTVSDITEPGKKSSEARLGAVTYISAQVPVTPSPSNPDVEHGTVEYTPTELHATSPPSRHDSVASKSGTVLNVRDSTFGPLVAAAMEVYGRQDVKKGARMVNVVTTEVTAVSCA